jgi:hypothetical protein
VYGIYFIAFSLPFANGIKESEPLGKEGKNAAGKMLMKI